VKLVLLGYGRMGTEVEKLALEKGHEIVLTLDVDSNRGGVGLSRESVDGADVIIDFTWPDAVVENVRRIAALGVPLVEGTTGWNEDIDEVRSIVESSGMGFVYAANFSIGANLLIKLTAEAGKLFDRFGDYDPYVFEHHHRGKVDAPSGTALRLAETVLASMTRKTQIQVGNPDGKIADESLHVSSLRAGTAFGRHQVGFDSPADMLELTLTARSREGLAQGALYAAEWIKGKKGFFEFSQCLGF
jgi:4-hydroxy-tetrahydrodipicolinate reductase